MTAEQELESLRQGVFEIYEAIPDESIIATEPVKRLLRSLLPWEMTMKDKT